MQHAWMSSIKRINRSGPKTDPWGTPLTTFRNEENIPSISTVWFLPVRKLFIQFRLIPWIPKDFKTSMSLLWSTRSNALEKSVYIISVASFSSNDLVHVFNVLSSCVVVPRLGKNPCWQLEMRFWENKCCKISSLIIYSSL